MDLSLINTQLGRWSVLEVSGEVDIATAPQLRSRLIELITQGCRAMVIDLSPVGFIDSTGLGVLVGARRRIDEVGGELGLVVPAGRIRDLFGVTGLSGIFTIADSQAFFDGR